MTWLSRLRGASRRDVPEADVVVVSRRGCHLCSEMEQVVAGVLASPARGARAGRLRVLDLDELGREDPQALQRWTTQVPVLLVDGREVARWRVSADEVREALRR
ncbi:glutaredoxin family protein [Ornithinimicrobium humiphilum]|uniref:Glutaredoxin-like protein DUF836 n=1 Tax=Ornithinimicrobium humiphilum TaxID=125288 RepID=A0A543KKI9_9MICO|nr:glutaredoxin family protein [Ornithinimicrobium humiphilum]TQM95595.1 glutaredoxin-like protein DUF836 [Ornithinimicrobium humiphilum]